jgi:hypothetical protein
MSAYLKPSSCRVQLARCHAVCSSRILYIGFSIVPRPVVSRASKDQQYMCDPTDTIAALAYILAFIRCLVDAGSRTLSGYGSIGALMCSNAPSTTRIWPEMKLAASLNRKTVALAMSLESPLRPVGMGHWFCWEGPLAERRSSPSVPAIGPGAMTLERTPWGPSSTARTADVASIAAFAAETWT